MCGWFFNLRLGLLTQVLAIELLYYFWLLLYDVSGEIAIEGGIPSFERSETSQERITGRKDPYIFMIWHAKGPKAGNPAVEQAEAWMSWFDVRGWLGCPKTWPLVVASCQATACNSKGLLAQRPIGSPPQNHGLWTDWTTLFS
jgi:hypothetical protein